MCIKYFWNTDKQLVILVTCRDENWGVGVWIVRETFPNKPESRFKMLNPVNVRSIQKLNLKMLTFKNSLLESVKGNNTQPIPTLQVESQLDFGTTACPTESPEHSVISATYSFPSPSKNFL